MQTNPPVNVSATRRFFSESPPHGPGALCDEGIVRGIGAVSACGEEHGLVDSHLGILAAVAQKQRVAFGFRPVNRFATQLIRQGYATKGLDIKGKSADWGPMAGFLPVAQKFSKLAGSPEEIVRSNQQVQDCIAAGNAVSMPLTLGTERLTTLASKGTIRIEGAFGRKQIRILADKNSHEHVFEGRLTLVDGSAEYSIFHHDAPVQVLAKAATATQKARPLTADYDLLLFAVPFNDIDSNDNYRPSPVNTARPKSLLKKIFRKAPDAECEKRLAAAARSSQAAQPDSHAAASSVACDISSPRLDALISTMNDALGRSNADRIVQHGPDTHNPYTVLAENYPSVIFMAQPDEETAQVFMVKNQQAAIKVYSHIKTRGFQFFGNDNWAKTIPKAAYRRPSYDLARNEMGTPAATAALSPASTPATPQKSYHRPSHDQARDAIEAAIASLNLSPV